MNQYLANKIREMWDAGHQIEDTRLEIFGPDVKPGSRCDAVIALHMDGATNKAAHGGSVGYPTSRFWKWSATLRDSPKLAARVKAAVEGIDPEAHMTRGDNYTRALQRYYGFKASYSSSARGKMVLEAGFVTNDGDLDWAIANREAIAIAILEGGARFLARPMLTPQPDKAAPAPALMPGTQWPDRPATRHGRVSKQADDARKAIAALDRAVDNLERLGLSGPDRG